MRGWVLRIAPGGFMVIQKMALRNFAGKKVRQFLVTMVAANQAATKAAPVPSHHICIIDVSGSMYGDLDAVKAVVEKVFTASEFQDPNILISLLTYSSNGDCRTHFERVTVAEVLAVNSPHLREIRDLRTRGATGISQSLVAAEKLIRPGEVTCISLHTDGYANDPSPYAESIALLKAVDAIAKHPSVFVNTVAYRDYCDFALLAAVANRCSGSCIQAKTARQVYEALYNTQAMLAGSMAPVIVADPGDGHFVTFVSKKARKVLGGTEPITVRGLASTDDATIYTYREMTEAEFDASTAPEWPDNMDALLAFARANLALGNINTAKYAMVSTGIRNLIQPHAKALTGPEIAALANDLETFLVDTPDGLTLRLDQKYGLGASGPSVLQVLQVLGQHTSGLRLCVPNMDYKRRGLKRIPGSRDANGAHTPATHRLQTDRDAPVSVASVDVNQDTATANIKTVQSGDLVVIATGEVIKEVAGIPLHLKDYRNYTVVSDGSVNISVLPIKTSDKRLFAWLKQNGLVTGDFDPNAQYDIRLGDLPLVAYDQTFDTIPTQSFEGLVSLTILSKILSAITKGESESLTADQVAALKDNYITPALYFSPPTTTPYSDLAAAISGGEVDTRFSYKIKLGTPDILHLGNLYSGNAYLQRRFDLAYKDSPTVLVAKPTLPLWWNEGALWKVKALSPRTKLDGVDAVTFPIYEAFLGLGQNTSLRDCLVLAGMQTQDIMAFENTIRGGVSRDEALATFNNAAKLVDAAIDRIYADVVTPLAFYVGSTGLVPDSYGAVALTADQLVAKHPNVSLAKAEKEGMFYELPNGLIISVFTEAVHFSTDLGVKVASAFTVQE